MENNIDQYEIEEVEKKIKNISSDKEIDPVYDGIIEIGNYSKQNIKILWILKEANDLHKDGIIYGGYDIRESLKKITIHTKGAWRKTFNPIIYTSYGILNGFKLWHEMGNTYRNQEIIDVLKSIAFINLKKIPGRGQSNMGVITSEYNKGKEIVLEQIKVFKPNVIIGGNTLRILNADLKLKFTKTHPKYAINHKQIYIDAYHPNNRMITQEEYCNSIINCVKDFLI